MPPRRSHEDALRLTGALRALAEFDPRVAGTPPLGLDLPDSDIDVLCHAPDAAAFAARVFNRFSGYECFATHQWTRGGRPVVAGFVAHGWRFEIFGAGEPVAAQAVWRHFVVERRLLALGGADLRSAVMAARTSGLKTEPAFAAVLGLGGDPYAALLELADWPDEALAVLVAAA